MPPIARHRNHGRRRRNAGLLRRASGRHRLTSALLRLTSAVPRLTSAVLRLRPGAARSDAGIPWPARGLPYFLTAAVLMVLGPATVLTLLPLPGSTLQATYAKVNDWGTGYTAQYTITNTGDRTQQGWRLSFDLPPGARVTNLLNGRHDTSGDRVTVRDRGWNRDVPGGRSVTVTFTVDSAAGGGDPSGCTINGRVCALPGNVPGATTSQRWPAMFGATEPIR
ncbi:cellulose binding domain-containing protein [Actinomadura hibisca]|uniref:cellulose binding domain-containing protein n=1 Tax=Actinomadura hibisca TaxID=68565 RepID=UPI00083275FA|nr:cellulose binding domain-containing protein [Actinomadura hibisca]